jgi:hypothetical protein
VGAPLTAGSSRSSARGRIATRERRIDRRRLRARASAVETESNARFTDVGDSLALESGETLSSSRTTGAKVDVRVRPVGTSRLAVAVAMVAERPPKRRVEDGMNAAPTRRRGNENDARAAVA